MMRKCDMWRVENFSMLFYKLRSIHQQAYCLLLPLGLFLFFTFSTGLAKETPHEDPKKSCVSAECHLAVKKYRYLHRPVSSDQCVACHEPIQAQGHKFVLVDEGKALCTNCHASLPAQKVTHKPVVKGACLSCHDPHGSEISGLVRESPISKVCKDCHKLRLTKKYVHGSVRGKCTECHQSHGSKAKNLLEVSGFQGCLHCHKTFKAILKRKKEHIHSVAKKDCRTCHHIHQSNLPDLLTRDAPKLCFECHEEIQKQAKKVEFPHKALTSKKACLNCHNPHFSYTKKLLRKQEALLCFTCHEEIQKQVTKAAFKHGPIKEGYCTPCHSVHGATHRKLLRNNFAKELYVSYKFEAYALCFDCHDRELAEEQITERSTKFRNGKVNLHFVHVNKDEKGRACRSCHSFHVGENSMRIRTEFQFGKWKLPIRFTKSKTGGVCSSGCHKVRSYDRINPVSINTVSHSGQS